jgi:hypothetical protein
MATAELLNDQVKQLVREILVEKIEAAICEKIEQRYGRPQEDDWNGTQANPN